MHVSTTTTTKMQWECERRRDVCASVAPIQEINLFKMIHTFYLSLFGSSKQIRFSILAASRKYGRLIGQEYRKNKKRSKQKSNTTALLITIKNISNKNVFMCATMEKSARTHDSCDSFFFVGEKNYVLQANRTFRSSVGCFIVFLCRWTSNDRKQGIFFWFRVCACVCVCVREPFSL